LLANCGWLVDWVNYCGFNALTATTREHGASVWHWWAADVGANHADRAFGGDAVRGGLVGLVGLLARGRRRGDGVRLDGAAAAGPVAGHRYWKPLEVIGCAKLFVLACTFAAAPCAARIPICSGCRVG